MEKPVQLVLFLGCHQFGIVCYKHPRLVCYGVKIAGRIQPSLDQACPITNHEVL